MSRDDSAEAKAETARQKARVLEWKSDPELRAKCRAILALPLIERLKQIEAESDVLDALESVDE